MSSKWRIEIVQYTGGAKYRLMRFDEWFESFNDIEELKGFGKLIKKDLNMEQEIPLRESVRHDYEEVIRVIEEIED